MSPASRRLGVIGLVIVIGLQPAALRAQARDSAAPSRFDPIARRVLTLKLQSETEIGREVDGQGHRRMGATRME